MDTASSSASATHVPDFTLIEQSHNIIGSELGKLRNIPEFNHGRLILDTLRQMQEQFDKLQQQFGQLQGDIGQLQGDIGQLQGDIGQLREQMDTRFDRVEMRQATAERNAVARTQNSVLIDSNTPLSVLYSINTGSPISDFPHTSADIMAMSSRALNTVLTELGLGIDGNITARRERLRVQAGLKRSPA